MHQQNILTWFAPILFAICFLTLSARAQETAPAPSPAAALRISTPEEIKAEFDAVPCGKNSERRLAVKALFEKMGAKPEDVMIEKRGGTENVVLRKPGAGDSPEKIVVGAHFDKAGGGSCGAVDNWTGIVAVAHLYRSLKDVGLKKEVIFVGFDREEEGLVGSSAMAGAIKKEAREQYCAMINIDSLGLGIPQTLDNVSSKPLIEFTLNLAREMNVPFAHVRVDGASSDSASFISNKIPAVTLHSLTDEWSKILHTRNDQAAKINHESVYLSYRVVLSLLVRVQDMDCQAFREKPKEKEKKSEEKK
jgi:Peptidase family M28